MPQEALKSAPYLWKVRVYYEDTDAGGVVYYANYLKFMERARSEWVRALGFDQSAMLHDHDLIFVVREVRIEYLKPARFDDMLDVTVQLLEAGRSQIVVAQTIQRGELLARAEVKLVCVNAQSFKPAKIPGTIKLCLERSA